MEVLPHLELPIRREDADPVVVVVGHDDVTVHVHRDAGGALQLARGATPDPKPHLEQAVVRKYLRKKNNKTLN